jgi:nitrilase
VYNTVLTFGPAGTLLGRHRKLIPTHAERLVWGMGDGSDLRGLDTRAGRLASLICWENYMPLARFHLYHQGPQIWVAPTLATADFWVASMRHIARESGCFRDRRRPGDPPRLAARLTSRPDAAPYAGRRSIRRMAARRLLGHRRRGRRDHRRTARRERGILIADLDLDSLSARKRWFDAPGITTAPTSSTRPSMTGPSPRSR